MTTFPAELARQLRGDASRPFITFYDHASGERVELSLTTYANWVSKVAGLLVEEGDLERGMRLRLDLPTHWLGPVFLGAAWTIGLAITDDDEEPDAVVCGPESLESWSERAGRLPVFACSLRPLGVRFADPLPGDVHDVGIEVWSQPDAFTAWDPPTGVDVAIEGGAKLILCINPMVPYDNSRHQPGRGLGDEGVQQIGSQVFRTFVHAGLHYHIKQVRRRHPEVDIILIEPTRDDQVMFADSTMRYTTRMAIARHSFRTVAAHLSAHYGYYRELLARHDVSISDTRISQDLQNLAVAGNDPRAVKAALVADGARPSAPVGLAHTLAELERLLVRLEGAGA